MVKLIKTEQNVKWKRVKNRKVYIINQKTPETVILSLPYLPGLMSLNLQHLHSV